MGWLAVLFDDVSGKIWVGLPPPSQSQLENPITALKPANVGLGAHSLVNLDTLVILESY
jgi:hypothetical protein